MLCDHGPAPPSVSIEAAGKAEGVAVGSGFVGAWDHVAGAQCVFEPHKRERINVSWCQVFGEIEIHPVMAPAPLRQFIFQGIN